MKARCPGDCRDAGFTLVEVLVAFVFLALVAGAAQVSFSGSWQGIRRAGNESGALETARAQLELAGHEGGFAERTEQGENGPYVWSRTIRRYVPAQTQDPRAEFQELDRDAAITGFWVNVSVSWREGTHGREKSLSLTTLKLGSEP